jgi:hypothetical protein
MWAAMTIRDHSGGIPMSVTVWIAIGIAAIVFLIFAAWPL